MAGAIATNRKVTHGTRPAIVAASTAVRDNHPRSNEKRDGKSAVRNAWSADATPGWVAPEEPGAGDVVQAPKWELGIAAEPAAVSSRSWWSS